MTLRRRLSAPGRPGAFAAGPLLCAALLAGAASAAHAQTGAEAPESESEPIPKEGEAAALSRSLEAAIAAGLEEGVLVAPGGPPLAAGSGAAGDARPSGPARFAGTAPARCKTGPFVSFDAVSGIDSVAALVAREATLSTSSSSHSESEAEASARETAPLGPAERAAARVSLGLGDEARLALSKNVDPVAEAFLLAVLDVTGPVPDPLPGGAGRFDAFEGCRADIAFWQAAERIRLGEADGSARLIPNFAPFRRLPAPLRRQVGAALIESLVASGRADTARRVRASFSATDMAASSPLQLASAVLALAEGEPGAEARLRAMSRNPLHRPKVYDALRREGLPLSQPAAEIELDRALRRAGKTQDQAIVAEAARGLIARARYEEALALAATAEHRFPGLEAALAGDLSAALLEQLQSEDAAARLRAVATAARASARLGSDGQADALRRAAAAEAVAVGFAVVADQLSHGLEMPEDYRAARRALEARQKPLSDDAAAAPVPAPAAAPAAAAAALPPPPDGLGGINAYTEAVRARLAAPASAPAPAPRPEDS